MAETKPKEVYSYTLEDKFSISDLEARKLFINQDIDDDALDGVVYHIMRYNFLDKGIPVKDRIPIKIYINSYGGSVTAGFAIIDAIKASKTPVYTINLGVCYSMAFMIFLAGDIRYATKNSSLLLHDGSVGGIDSSNKMRDRIEFETTQTEKRIRDMVINSTKITEEMYDRNLRTEWYMYANTGKSLGVVDYIIGEDVELDAIL